MEYFCKIFLLNDQLNEDDIDFDHFVEVYFQVLVFSLPLIDTSNEYHLDHAEIDRKPIHHHQLNHEKAYLKNSIRINHHYEILLNVFIIIFNRCC